MRSRYIIAVAMVLIVLIGGCKVKEEEVVDETTKDEVKQDALNCSDDIKNSYGCYGDDKKFAELELTTGVWSIYIRSNLSSSVALFYDRYERSYDFRSDGTMFKQQRSGGYTTYGEWGVDDKGTILKLSDGNTLTYKKQFANQSNCFEITRNSDTVKLCRESLQSGNSNSAGLYGSDIKFGSLADYTFDVIAEWEIDSGSVKTTVKLDKNGTTSSGGIWGVSADAKIISIDGDSYLTHQYNQGSDRECIDTLELQGSQINANTWRLCRL